MCARATGSESLVQHGVTGRLIRPGAVGEFADALAHYCTDADARAAAGEAAQAFAERFGWDQVNQALLDTYRRVIAQRERGAQPKASPVP